MRALPLSLANEMRMQVEARESRLESIHHDTASLWPPCDSSPDVKEQMLAHAPYQAEATTAAMRRAVDVEGAPSRLCIKAAAPWEMLGCNEAFYAMFGFAGTGCTLKILHGQTTRMDVLESTISAAARGGVHECQLRLYTACGQPLLLRLQVSQVQSLPGELALPDQMNMLLLSFAPAVHFLRAIDLEHDMSPGASAEVKNTAPFHVLSVSPDWAQMYGMSHSTVVGRGLRVIEGPATDLRVVRKMKELTARGVEAKASFITYDASGKQLWTHFSTMPLQSPNGMIDSCIAHAFSYDTLDLNEAMSATQGHLLVVSVQGHKHITHTTRDLCELLSCGNSQMAGVCCKRMLESTANSEVLQRLVAEVVHGECPQLAPHLMTLQGSKGNVVSSCSLVMAFLFSLA